MSQSLDGTSVHMLHLSAISFGIPMGCEYSVMAVSTDAPQDK